MKVNSNIAFHITVACLARFRGKTALCLQYLVNGWSTYWAHNYAVHTGKMIAGCKRRETYHLSACND
jgi:hypothetical protein